MTLTIAQKYGLAAILLIPLSEAVYYVWRAYNLHWSFRWVWVTVAAAAIYCTVSAVLEAGDWEPVVFR